MSDDVENCRASQQMVKGVGYIYIYTHRERERGTMSTIFSQLIGG